MILNINKITKKIPEGTYTGIINQTTVTQDETFIWFTIIVDGLKVSLNTSLAVNSEIFTKFAAYYVDDEGSFDTIYLDGASIEFSVEDREAMNGNIYSRITALAPFVEDQEYV